MKSSEFTKYKYIKNGMNFPSKWSEFIVKNEHISAFPE